jgi:tetratricopeptide (TPR) repeat protein
MRALDAGRPEQARVMITAAIGEGATGPAVDRLLADLAATEQRWPEATARYQALLVAAPDDAALLRSAGIAALQMGDLNRAQLWLDRAVRLPSADWRAWSARGVAADRRRDWATADRAYAAGLTLAPDNPVLLNNLGWSLLLRGRWQEAATSLTRAARLSPANRRIADNAELARAGVAADLPARRDGESDAAFAARLNDAGVIAFAKGEKGRAIAAFARALEVSDAWFDRAANNLALAEGAGN